MILTYKTRKGKEDEAIQEILSENNEKIISLTKRDDVKGYIFVETNYEESIIDMMRQNRYVTQKVEGTVYPEEILIGMGKIREYKKGDKVVVTKGALKGEKGIVREVRREQVVIILDDSAVIIPVVLKTEGVDLLEAIEKEEVKKSNKVGSKSLGEKMETYCIECGEELEYVYIPSKRRPEILQETGNKVIMGESRDKIIGDDLCPRCGKNLKRFWRNLHGGAQLL